MRKRVLAGLKKKGRGIILFHDIQRSTQRGLDKLLHDLKKRGYKVVHMIAKSNAQTVAAYDAIVAKRIKRTAKKKAANPLADRAVTWPNASGTGKTPDGELPWLKTTSPRKRAAKRPKRPAPPKPDYEDRWQIRPFGR